MKVTRAIPIAATLGLGTALFAVPAHAIPWGQADYWGMTEHATNCNCAAAPGAAVTPTAQQAAQQTEVAKQGAQSPNGLAPRQTQQR